MYCIKHKNKESGDVFSGISLHDEKMANRVCNRLNEKSPAYEHWFKEEE